jgi:hypothetical protein
VFFSIKNKEKNFRSFPDGYHFDKNKFGVIRENTILSVDIQTDQIRNEWENNTLVQILIK